MSDIIVWTSGGVVNDVTDENNESQDYCLIDLDDLDEGYCPYCGMNMPIDSKQCYECNIDWEKDDNETILKKRAVYRAKRAKSIMLPKTF